MRAWLLVYWPKKTTKRIRYARWGYFESIRYTPDDTTLGDGRGVTDKQLRRTHAGYRKRGGPCRLSAAARGDGPEIVVVGGRWPKSGGGET